MVKVTTEIHSPAEEGKSDVSTSTEKNHDNFVSSGHRSTVQGQKTVTPEVPQVFKREVIDLTYEDACRNEMVTQTEDFPPLQPDTSNNGIDLSKSTTTDKDISSTNSISINIEDASATSFNTSSDSINTFASKMQHLNLKKGDDNLNEVEPKFNELNQGPKLIEVSMNGEENYSDQGKKAENAPKTQESYSHFVQSISPPSRVTSSSPVQHTENDEDIRYSPPLKVVINEARDEIQAVKMMLSSVLKRGPKESDEVPSKKFKEDSSVPVKMYSMHSRPSSQASSTKSSKKNSDNSEDIDEDNLLQDDEIPILGDDDLGENFLSDDLLMAKESSSSKLKGVK